MKRKPSLSYNILIIVAMVLVVFYVVGQTLSLFNYRLAVSLGLQESVVEVGDVGIAWAKGFAFADTIIYIPLLLLGIIGLQKGIDWGLYSMMGAMAISIYWPIVSLYAIYAGSSVLNLSSEKYLSYSIILPLIALYGLWGMIYLYRHRGDYE